MRMISYAQNGEDVLLDRVFHDVDRGFYVDVGANDPVFDSVTKHFYDRGWRGVNIEPQPKLHRRLVEDRPRDINLHLGVSDREGTLTFHEAPSADGWSTFSELQAKNLRERNITVIERPVPVTTLARVCEQYVDQPIDFLKIDAESFESQVIGGADWSRWRPRVVLIETNGWEQWEPMLLTRDYLYAVFDGVNRFYVRAEDRHLLPRLAAPVNVADDAMPYPLYRYIEDLKDRAEELNALSRPTRALVRRWCRFERGLVRLASRLGTSNRRAG